jgi:hypothetical protein
MNVRLLVRRCLRILGVEIVFPEIRQRRTGDLLPLLAHTETDAMKIVALTGGSASCRSELGYTIRERCGIAAGI